MSLMRKKIFLCQVHVQFCFRSLLRPCLLHEEQINKMQLFIRGQETFVVECQEHEIVSNLKAKITEACDFGSTEFVLSCNGQLLSNETPISSLTSNSLDLNVLLPGGKVHGSLARAGKVKGQTPKVEKQEKSKKKTGRAKRRIQYNRRFVTVVPTFGRRRGPNANPQS
ncbi:uncharacterized protein LOC123260339 [Cotesia glomerata]|nr:uncharacterized protein LOC123260339 [Cotesia glomerata]